MYLVPLNIPFIHYFPKEKRFSKTRNYINIDTTVADCAEKRHTKLLRERERDRLEDYFGSEEVTTEERSRKEMEDGDLDEAWMRERERERRVPSRASGGFSGVEGWAPRALNIHADLSSADCHL